MTYGSSGDSAPSAPPPPAPYPLASVWGWDRGGYRPGLGGRLASTALPCDGDMRRNGISSALGERSTVSTVAKQLPRPLPPRALSIPGDLRHGCALLPFFSRASGSEGNASVPLVSRGRPGACLATEVAVSRVRRASAPLARETLRRGRRCLSRPGRPCWPSLNARAVVISERVACGGFLQSMHPVNRRVQGKKLALTWMMLLEKCKSGL